jgi:hypothetical protein
LSHSFGVDHIVKAGSRAPVCRLDITAPDAQEMVRDWLRLPSLVYVHLGVPCGTSSRAREIRTCATDPPPLRSEEWPEGLPRLPPREAARVETANKIYQFAASVILLCNELGKDWTLEQPHRSLFWKTKYWRSVEQHLDPVFVKFDHCMYKGSRPKRTMVAGSFASLKGLETFCDGQHAHLPWGRTPHGFATAEEVQYPLELCRAWGAIVAEHVKETWPDLSEVPHLPSPGRGRSVELPQYAGS